MATTTTTVNGIPKDAASLQDLIAQMNQTLNIVCVTIQLDAHSECPESTPQRTVIRDIEPAIRADLQPGTYHGLFSLITTHP